MIANIEVGYVVLKDHTNIRCWIIKCVEGDR